MEEVQKILQNPLVKAGLKVAAPEIALGVDLAILVVGSIFGSRKKKKPSAEKLLGAIDKRLADILKDLALTKSKGFRQECEIRAHELLGILNEWEKIK